MKELREKYKQLKPLIKDKFWGKYFDGNQFQLHLISALSKSYEFNRFVNKKTKKKLSFFASPTLRGICEDFIVLKFLKKHKTLDSNKILNNYMQIQLHDIVSKQSKFFKKNHPQQIVLTDEKFEGIEQLSNDLKDEWAKIGMNKEKIFPSISHMATDAGLVELYEFLYSATSDMVHFSPHVLMRSGWSKTEDKYLHHFSTKNFSKYYDLYNKFYGSYLFCLFVKEFKKDLEIDKNAIKLVDEIKEIILSESRWPELVTFEEMNIPNAEKIRMINAIRKISQLITHDDGRTTSIS